MKLKDFGRESLVLIKNYGANKIGRIVRAVGIGTVSGVVLYRLLSSHNDQTEFGRKFEKGFSIAGLTAAFGGMLMEDLSENKRCLTFDKGTISEDYQTVLDSVPKG